MTLKHSNGSLLKIDNSITPKTIADLSYEKFNFPNSILNTSNNCFLVSVPDLPGCMGDGITQKEAVDNTLVIISEWIETAKLLGREIPEPSFGRESLEKYLREGRNTPFPFNYCNSTSMQSFSVGSFLLSLNHSGS